MLGPVLSRMADPGTEEDRKRGASKGGTAGMLEDVPPQHCAPMRPLVDCCPQYVIAAACFRVSPHPPTAYNYFFYQACVQLPLVTVWLPVSGNTFVSE